MRNQIIERALRDAENHLANAEESPLKSAIECLLSAVKDMAETDAGVDPSDSYPDLYDYPTYSSEPRDYYVFIDEDSHVAAWYSWQASLESAAYNAERARCRAIVEATFARRKVTRANPSGL